MRAPAGLESAHLEELGSLWEGGEVWCGGAALEQHVGLVHLVVLNHLQGWAGVVCCVVGWCGVLLGGVVWCGVGWEMRGLHQAWPG